MKHESLPPTRREFLQKVATGASAALISSALPAWADHHPHPTPQSLPYLDRNSYRKNADVIAHILPGENRVGKMQFMAIGNRRYIFQQGDVIDVSDVRKPMMFNKAGYEGYQVQIAYNNTLKKWTWSPGRANAHHRFHSRSSDGKI